MTATVAFGVSRPQPDVSPDSCEGNSGAEMKGDEHTGDQKRGYRHRWEVYTKEAAGIH